MRFAKIMILLNVLTGCGADNSGGSEAQVDPAVTTQRHESLLVLTAADLPTCDTTRSGVLAYSSQEKKFYGCTGTSWTALDVKGEKGDAGAVGAKGDTGADGLKMASVWRFHVDSYVGAVNLASEAATLEVQLGTIQLVKFTDGSALITTTGLLSRLTLASDRIYENFTHTFMLPAGAAEQSYITKIDSYAMTRTRYKVQLGDTPTLKAVVDINNNFDDVPDTAYTLTKVN
jgi:hypothetical protein